jgi:hypothetical protein
MLVVEADVINSTTTVSPACTSTRSHRNHSLRNHSLGSL